MNLLAELLTNTTAPESGVRLTKKESVIAEKPGPCTYYDKVVVPWSPPLCAHTLANGLPARRWNDGVCTICGGLSPSSDFSPCLRKR